MKYQWQQRCTSHYADEEKVIKAKVAFKTQEKHWLGTSDPVIALISIHSAFHKGFSGELKMQSFISTLKEHVKGRITVLLTDRAHMHVTSLHYENDLNKSLGETRKDAFRLSKRYQTYFDPCHVAFWHNYIYENEDYSSCCQKVRELYQTDLTFRKHLQEDAEKTAIRQTFSNEEIFYRLAIEDILEQCVCILVLAKMGYRFQFYPGISYTSTDYVNQILLSHENRIEWIHVFLSIEKKSVLI